MFISRWSLSLLHVCIFRADLRQAELLCTEHCMYVCVCIGSGSPRATPRSASQADSPRARVCRGHRSYITRGGVCVFLFSKTLTLVPMWRSARVFSILASACTRLIRLIPLDFLRTSLFAFVAKRRNVHPKFVNTAVAATTSRLFRFSVSWCDPRTSLRCCYFAFCISLHTRCLSISYRLNL